MQFHLVLAAKSPNTMVVIFLHLPTARPITVFPLSKVLLKFVPFDQHPDGTMPLSMSAGRFSSKSTLTMSFMLNSYKGFKGVARDDMIGGLVDFGQPDMVATSTRTGGHTWRLTIAKMIT
ncbi:hypothetical protein HAX54_046407 [Datura stramonium]|uniref:Dirigent protein n=1 Tax=Datura stramonium TaxID=4076 RepID=A0ABS8SRS4_DATST|nr:hypothetical protein [Datura stramonium]